MARGQKQYTEEFKNTIVELHNAGKSLVELSSEYALSKSTMILTLIQERFGDKSRYNFDS